MVEREIFYTGDVGLVLVFFSIINYVSTTRYFLKVVTLFIFIYEQQLIHYLEVVKPTISIGEKKKKNNVSYI
jgi:hypothetical protein